MPKLNGLEAVKKIKNFIENLNKSDSNLTVQEPMFII